jgi:hypothetical protein
VEIITGQSNGRFFSILPGQEQGGHMSNLRSRELFRRVPLISTLIVSGAALISCTVNPDKATARIVDPNLTVLPACTFSDVAVISGNTQINTRRRDVTPPDGATNTEATNLYGSSSKFDWGTGFRYTLNGTQYFVTFDRNCGLADFSTAPVSR